MNENEVAWLAGLKENHQATVNENARLMRELAEVKLALQKSNDDMGGGTVAEVVARVVKERDTALTRAEKAERALAAADVEDTALAKLAEAEAEANDRTTLDKSSLERIVDEQAFHLISAEHTLQAADALIRLLVQGEVLAPVCQRELDKWKALRARDSSAEKPEPAGPCAPWCSRCRSGSPTCPDPECRPCQEWGASAERALDAGRAHDSSAEKPDPLRALTPKQLAEALKDVKLCPTCHGMRTVGTGQMVGGLRVEGQVGGGVHELRTPCPTCSKDPSGDAGQREEDVMPPRPGKPGATDSEPRGLGDPAHGRGAAGQPATGTGDATGPAAPTPMPEPAGTTMLWCPQCGPHPQIDEDGCCAACGATCGSLPLPKHVAPTPLTRERLGAALARTHDLCRREGGGHHAVLRALELLHDEVLREPDAGPAFAAAAKERRYEVTNKLSDDIENDHDCRAWAEDVRTLEEELTAVKAALMPTTATFQEFESMRQRSPADAVRRIVEENRALNAQVTSLQTRCTELLEEKRRAHVDYAVREFHLKFDQPAPAEPGVPPDDVVRFRAKLMTEEYLELLDAMFGGARERPWWFKDLRERLAWYIDHAPVEVDLVKWAHETHDLDYTVAGTRVAFGYKGLAGAAEVHRANLSKGPNDERGKPTKPEGWKPPDIEGVLRAQGWKP